MAEKICQGARGGGVRAESSADSVVQEFLQNVKVSKLDAKQLQQELEKDIFQNFSESWEVMTNKKMLFPEKNKYLDYLQQSFEDIDSKVREKIQNVLTEEKSWDFKMAEWKSRKIDGSGAIYGIIVFGRYPDQKCVDVMLVLYSMKYVLDERAKAKTREQEWFHPYANNEDAYDFGSITPIQNLFRVKALEEFRRQGIIKSINYVNSLEDIQESPFK